MRERLWAIESNGRITAEIGTYRLTIMMVGGSLRFLIHDCRHSALDGSRPPLVASGTRPSIPAAIAAAEAITHRLIAAYSSGADPGDFRVIPAPLPDCVTTDIRPGGSLDDWIRPASEIEDPSPGAFSPAPSKPRNFFIVRRPEAGAADDGNLFARP